MIEKNVKEYKFLNFPQEYDLTEYQKVLEGYIDRIKEKQGVLSIYQEGKIYAPGLSDLDIIVVVEDGFDRVDETYLINESDEREKYIFLYQPVILEESLAKNYTRIHQPFTWKRLWGKSYPLVETAYLTKLVTAIDIVINSYPVDFLRPLLSKRIDVRLVLARLNGLRYITYQVETLTGKKVKDPITDEVDDLRSNWFKAKELDRLSDLLLLLERGLEQSLFIIGLLKTELSKAGARCNGNSSFYKYASPLIFLLDWDKERVIEKSEEIFRKVSFLTFSLPSVFALPFLYYRSRENDFGKYIKNNFFFTVKPEFSMPKSFKEEYSDRGDLVDNHNRFVRRNNLIQGLFISHGFEGEIYAETGFKQKLISWEKRRRLKNLNIKKELYD